MDYKYLQKDLRNLILRAAPETSRAQPREAGYVDRGIQLPIPAWTREQKELRIYNKG